MIEILILVAVAVGLFAALWAVAVLVGRPGEPAGPLAEHDLLYDPRAAAPDPSAEHRIVVADLSTLRMRLAAAGILLRAPRVAVVIVAADGEHEIAAVEHAMRPGPVQEIAAQVGARVLLVAVRTSADAAFDERDGRLLAATAATLGDVLAIPEEERRAPTGRFMRRSSVIPGRRGP